ncbi:MAG: methyltransferase domain-containing protein, partial [Armatimonadetes bacterium]|nr:methyltransferase domain-containing protein [Armatimonadota bacterium]
MTDINTIKSFCRRYNISPQKRFSQNFLIDRAVLDKIIRVADLSQYDIVLEIGPGLGVLTRELAKRVKKVLVIEIDKKIVAVLKEIMKDYKNVEIFQGDILRTELKIENLKFKIVSN